MLYGTDDVAGRHLFITAQDTFTELVITSGPM